MMQARRPQQCAQSPDSSRREIISARFLIDDLAWLQARLAELALPESARERELAAFYRNLTTQRRAQLEALSRGHAGSWPEFLG